MKRVAVAVAGLLVALSIAACGGGDSGIDGGSSTEVTVAQAEGKPRGELQISNWPLYIDKKTIPEFEQASGVSVKYVEDVNSYEEFFGTMQPLLVERSHAVAATRRNSTALMVTPGAAQLLAGGAVRRACSSVSKRTIEKP
jgi:hypothetical protein